MYITKSLRDSLQYPKKDWVKIIILGIILIIPIVNFIGLGYYLRIIKSTLAGLDELPGFEYVGELFIDGLKIFIVGIIYAFIPLIFYALQSVFPGSLVFFLIAIILSLIISIFAYMGIANMAYHEGELAGAFRYHEIFARIAAIGWENYILWWIILTLILVVAGFIIIIVGGILLFYVVGLVVVLLGYSYLVMFQARSVALTFVSRRQYLR